MDRNRLRAVRMMIKKYLLISLSLLLVVSSISGARAGTSDMWLVKSKTDPVFTLWFDGTITYGEPESTTTATTTTLEPKKYTSAKKWFTHGDTVYTPWARKPITYAVETAEGNYRIGLSAKNYAGGDGWTKPSKYTYFKVKVYLDNRKKGMLRIEASDTQINTGYLEIENIEVGTHEVKFIWTNDKYKPGKKQDANIEIHSVIIEQI